MGLPVDCIICGHQDSAVWDLIHHGQVRTDNGLPENLERLVSGALGVEENLRFCQVCQDKRLYTLQPEALETLQKGMYAAVTSWERLLALIPSVYRTSGYIMGPQTAMAYGALQDYQAMNGANHLALVLSEKSPVRDSKLVADAMSITQRELEKKLGE
jgi:threonine synthase